MDFITLPSGLDISPQGLYRHVSKLTSEDLEFISKQSKSKALKKTLKELLGRSFANLYSKRREEKTGQRLNWWSIHKGKYQAKFSDAALNAKIHKIDLKLLILRAENFAQSKGLIFPTPYMVCGPWVFSEVLNGWRPSIEMSLGEEEHEEKDLIEDHGDSNWIWQPGYDWDPSQKEFVKNES